MSTEMAAGQYRQRGPTSAAYSQAENYDYGNALGTDSQGFYANQPVSTPSSPYPIPTGSEELALTLALYSTTLHTTTML